MLSPVRRYTVQGKPIQISERPEGNDFTLWTGELWKERINILSDYGGGEDEN